MKYILTILFAFTLLINIEAQDSGIQFSHDNWESTLEQAKKEDKIIFVDAYTTWCGPCKWMNANVFPDQAVGDYFNENFVNVKIDMEKGEGILFAKAYDVIAYPTLLFINSTGDMVHKGLGGRAPEELISLGQAASDPGRQIGSLERKYKAGVKDPKLLRSYAIALRDAGETSAATIASEYLSNETDWNTEENMEFIFNMANWQDMDDKLFQHVSNNKEVFIKSQGKNMVMNRLKMGPMVKAFGMPGLGRKEKEAIFHQVFPENYIQYTDEFEMNMKRNEEGDGFLQAAADYLSKYDITDSNELNELAWTVYEMTDDKKYLKLAKKWVEKSIAINSNYMNYDTLAAICFKLKEKKSAIKHAEKAIELAEANGEDASHTVQLLKKIQDL